MNAISQILRLDASANVSTSSSKKLGDELIARLRLLNPGADVKQRDLNQDLYFIDESWVGANFTRAGDRSPSQQQQLDLSDQLIEELQQADHIVLTTPMYNFGIPAALKAWIDLICRAGVTFQYTPEGPVGLLRNKSLDIVITTGGVPLQSPVDFASDYLKQVFGFIGIEQVTFIAADQMQVDADASLGRARTQIETNYAMASA